MVFGKIQKPLCPGKVLGAFCPGITARLNEMSGRQPNLGYSYTHLKLVF